MTGGKKANAMMADMMERIGGKLEYSESLDEEISGFKNARTHTHKTTFTLRRGSVG